MGNEERLLELLKNSRLPVTGNTLAEKLGVSRQMVVQYVATLRARGHRIFSSPKGYQMMKYTDHIQKLVAVKHSEEDIYKELHAIVKAGGKVVDVIVEHPIYGELRGILDIETEEDVVKFIGRLKTSNASPLLELSGGVHLHTLEAKDVVTMAKVIDAIKEYLI
ncbi:transcriptional regulator [Kosmotoga arenicorallina S304]|uniref:Transcriptional regulator n=1 Tax=Kosmotoga arenicorallina S304 TaxID=1453497 RepID=A0A176K1C6_9BACT|nr:transcription repressor NadR [Kosmotoga arenicorallina]OAA30688.1 transcriptional regulator [Kosmotoga arenicorallina S304]